MLKKFLLVYVTFSVFVCFAALQPAQAGFDEGWQAYLRKDYPLAIRAWKPLAEKGDAKAMVALGRLYLWGYGVEANFDTARRLFNGAVKKGNLDAFHGLAMLEVKRGLSGVAVDHWRQAAERGHARSQDALAQALSLGISIKKDAAEAYYWYRKAAEQGSTFAQYNLAGTYLAGKGTPQDLMQAYIWHTIVMENQGELSRYKTYKLRARYARDMAPTQIELARRHAEEWLAKKGFVNRPPVPRSGENFRFPTERIDRGAWRAYRDEVIYSEGAIFRSYPENQLVVENPAERALYFITQTGHKAYPSIIKLRVVDSSGDLDIELESYFSGDESKYRKWRELYQDTLADQKFIQLYW